MNEQYQRQLQAADAAAAALLAEEEAEAHVKRNHGERKGKAKAKRKKPAPHPSTGTLATPQGGGGPDTPRSTADLPSTSNAGTPSDARAEVSATFHEETQPQAVNKVLTERARATDTEGAEQGMESLEERAAFEGMEAAVAPRMERNVAAGNAARSKQEKERERKARQRERKAAAATRALEKALEEVESHGTGSGCLEALTQAVKEAERFTRDNPDLRQLMGRARATAKAASLEHLEEDMARM
eukprot:gene19405-23202_t